MAMCNGLSLGAILLGGEQEMAGLCQGQLVCWDDLVTLSIQMCTKIDFSRYTIGVTNKRKTCAGNNNGFYTDYHC